MQIKNIVICGYGPGAIALASKLSINSDYHVSIFSLKKNKIPNDIKIIWPRKTVTSIEKCAVFHRPEEYQNIADCIILCNPFPSYPEYLKEAEKISTSENSLILGAPGACGFDLIIRTYISSNKFRHVAAIESLPFITRISKKENLVTVLEEKNHLYVAQTGPNICSAIEKLVGTKLISLPNFLTLSLLNPAAKLHPALMEAHFRHSNEIPNNFYDVSEKCIEKIHAVDNEVANIAKSIFEKIGLNTSEILSFEDWYKSCYAGKGVQNLQHGLKKSLSDNSVLKLLSSPKKISNNRTVPNFESRYITEDVIFGLLFYKGLAEILSMGTPIIDSLISWAQNKISKKYIIDDRLNRALLSETGAPQRYGIKTLSQLSRVYQSRTKNLVLEKTEFQKTGFSSFGKLVSDKELKEFENNVRHLIKDNPKTEKLVNLHYKMSFIADFCSKPEFVRVAETLLDVDTVKIFSSMILVKPPGGHMVVPWHQDAAYEWPLDPLDCATLWLAMDDVTKKNGAMHMILNSHSDIIEMGKTPKLNDGEYFFSPQLERSIDSEVANKSNLILNTMKKGECSYHHSLTPHSSPPNTTSTRRLAFVVRYCKGNARINKHPGMPREEYFKDFYLFNPYSTLVE